MNTNARSASPFLIAVAAMMALAVVMGIGRFAFTPMLPLMLRDDLVTLQQGGWLATINYIGYFVGAMLCIVIRSYSRQAIRQSLAATIILTGLMGIMDGQTVWLILRFVTGVVTGLGFVAISGWCLGWLGATDRLHLGGIMYAGPGVGILVSGLVGSAMFNHAWHSQAAWLWCAVLALASSLSVWWVVNRRASSKTLATFSSTSSVSSTSSAPSTSNTSYASSTSSQGQAVIPDKPMRLIISGHILAYGLEGFGYIITATFLPVMASRALADAGGQSLLWPLFGLCVALGALMATRIPVTWNGCKLLAVLFIFQGLGVLCTIFWLDIVGFALGSILLGLPFTVITLFGMREARRLGGPKGIQLMAALTASYALGQIVGPPLATYLVERTGSFNASLGVAAAILFAGALMYMALFALERKRRS